MDFFDVLAVIGAVTGSIGAATQVYVARRDRADVRVGFGYRDELGKMIEPYLDLTNAGRQPVTILDAGIYGGEIPISIHKADSDQKLHGVGHAPETPRSFLCAELPGDHRDRSFRLATLPFPPPARYCAGDVAGERGGGAPAHRTESPLAPGP